MSHEHTYREVSRLMHDLGSTKLYLVEKTCACSMNARDAQRLAREAERAAQIRREHPPRIDYLTVGRAIELLRCYPRNAQLRAFMPSDPEGPCTYEKPVFALVDGIVRIDPSNTE